MDKTARQESLCGGIWNNIELYFDGQPHVGVETNRPTFGLVWLVMYKRKNNRETEMGEVH